MHHEYSQPQTAKRHQMAPHLTLYRANGSCSLAPHILLHELALPFTTILLKPASPGGGSYAAADGSFTHAWYRANINPLGLVPALAVGTSTTPAVIVTEMPAILTYLASLAPERGLAGVGELERAGTVAWCAWLSGTLHGIGFGGLWRPGRFAEGVEGERMVVARAPETIRGCFERVELRLGEEGGEVAVKDFYLYVFFRWGEQIGMPMAERYPRYAARMRVVEGRESVRRAVGVEGVGLLFG
ncbi:hypothetical protein B0T25DRAFT_556326 [Lasiosphaeria hispida]|uniref:GST N-terminal domain-containing protein n=1 Tax=Lasiosphaeria hispida TaxID=260671 RepID=A0AAJ0H9B2_9PEZI|nr:hypothetical protein B0T25DRAFT_556326 [Lasiosphaeria hispida]